MGCLGQREPLLGLARGVQMNAVVWEEAPNICEQAGFEPVRKQWLHHPRVGPVSSPTAWESQFHSSLLLPRASRERTSGLSRKLASHLPPPFLPTLQTPLSSTYHPVSTAVLLPWSWGHRASLPHHKPLLLHEVISGEKLYIAED